MSLCGGANDVVVIERPLASASVFVREFENMMIHHGLRAFKYGTKRHVHLRLDASARMLVWGRSRVLLADVARVTPRDDTGVAIEATRRSFLLGFEDSDLRNMFVDGLSLLVAEMPVSALV